MLRWELEEGGGDTWDKSGWCTFSLTLGVQCGSATLVEADNFTYDLVGNRTDLGAQIDPGNRLTRIAAHGDTIVYEYDAAGNVIRREEAGLGRGTGSLLERAGSAG